MAENREQEDCPATTTTQRTAGNAYANESCKNSENKEHDSPATTFTQQASPLEEHQAAFATREQSIIETLRLANKTLRLEIEQRDKLEEQMEEEISRLVLALEEAVSHASIIEKQALMMEKELTKERAQTDKLVKQKHRIQKSLEKAKEKHQELKMDMRKRRRAAFTAALETHCSDDEGNEVDRSEGGTPKKKRARKKNVLVGQTMHGKDSKQDLKWIEMFEELKLFKQEFGHCDVPAKWKSTNPRWAKLACWVSTQRTQHKLLRTGEWTNLRPERVRELQALGFKWNGQPNTVTMCFEDRVKQLIEYKKQHGDCNVPQKYEECPGLGNFVLQQRKYYRLGTMSQERIERLESVGFMWSLRNRGGPLAERMKNPPRARASHHAAAAEELPAHADEEGGNADEVLGDANVTNMQQLPPWPTTNQGPHLDAASGHQTRHQQHQQPQPPPPPMWTVPPPDGAVVGAPSPRNRHQQPQPPPPHQAWIANDYPYMYNA